ncbi:transposase [Candidatus Parcubacteria bacterium]|nr:transposase [Candidatus Parcubacteria bacterium]
MKKHRPLHAHPNNSTLFLTARIYGGFSYLAPTNTKDYILEKTNSILSKYQVDLDAWIILDNHYHFLIKAGEGKQVGPFIRELHGATAHLIKKNFPSLITEFGQQLTSQATPWDRRQTRKLNYMKEQLERELKFANADECARNSAVHCAPNYVLAQFIARHQRNFKPEVYRELKFAITEGHLTDPAVLISLVSKDTPVWYQYTDHIIRDAGDYFRHLNYTHQNSVKHGYTKRMSAYKFSSLPKFVKEKGKEWVLDCFRKYPVIDFEPEGIVD